MFDVYGQTGPIGHNLTPSTGICLGTGLQQRGCMVGEIKVSKAHQVTDIGEFIPHEEAPAQAIAQSPLAVPRCIDGVLTVKFPIIIPESAIDKGDGVKLAALLVLIGQNNEMGTKDAKILDQFTGGSLVNWLPTEEVKASNLPILQSDKDNASVGRDGIGRGFLL